MNTLNKHKRYKLLREIGRGGRASVLLAKDLYQEKEVVCKVFKTKNVWHFGRTKHGTCLPFEIKALQHLSGFYHANVVDYLDYFTILDCYVIVMTYLPQWTDLFDFIDKHGALEEEKAQRIAIQCAHAVDFIQTQGFCHNDIKDENILIHPETLHIKLIDFGSATEYVPGQLKSVFYGTKVFAAPEVIKTHLYQSEAQDVWSLGILFFVLLYGTHPFASDEAIVSVDVTMLMDKMDIKISDAARQAISEMLEKCPKKRPNTKHVLAMKFLKPDCSNDS